MKFPKNNDILYFQDMRFFKGIPSDIDFGVERTSVGWKLTTCGYGCLRHRGCYGAGSLSVSEGNMREMGPPDLIDELDSCF